MKGSEKSSSKDNKKKAEEARIAEEAERKRSASVTIKWNHPDANTLYI